MRIRNEQRGSFRLLVFSIVWLAAFQVFAVSSHAAKKFEKKECLDCHTKFAQKYLGMKDVHQVVKEKKCEECHIRHGIVPKLLLKETGTALCVKCHGKDKIGMGKKFVHTALKAGNCTQCHTPHASEGRKLLRVEGNAVCYTCHKKEAYEKKVVHKVLSEGGCLACHMSHSADEKNLLTKADPQLCLSCHDSGKASFKKAHGGYPVATKRCTT